MKYETASKPRFGPLIPTVCSAAENTAAHPQTHVHRVSMDHEEQRELMSWVLECDTCCSSRKSKTADFTSLLHTKHRNCESSFFEGVHAAVNFAGKKKHKKNPSSTQHKYNKGIRTPKINYNRGKKIWKCFNEIKHEIISLLDYYCRIPRLIGKKLLIQSCSRHFDIHYKNGSS